MTEPEYLPDTWYPRDFPILRETVRMIDEQGPPVMCNKVADAAGIDRATAQRAFNALKARGLVETGGSFGQAHTHVSKVAGQAYVLTGAHPSGETALRELLRQLADAEEHAAPEEKGKLAKARTALADISRGVIVDVMAGVIRGQIPM